MCCECQGGEQPSLEMATDGNAHHHGGGLKSRGVQRNGGAGERGAGTGPVGKHAKANHVYRVVIVIVGIFFLMETIGNGLVFLRLRETDLQQRGSSSSSLEMFFPRAATADEEQSPGDGVRFVPRVLVERLLLSRKKATLAELRKATRAPGRPPRLALVCIRILEFHDWSRIQMFLACIRGDDFEYISSTHEIWTKP